MTMHGKFSGSSWIHQCSILQMRLNISIMLPDMKIRLSKSKIFFKSLLVNLWCYHLKDNSIMTRMSASLIDVTTKVIHQLEKSKNYFLIKLLLLQSKSINKFQ